MTGNDLARAIRKVRGKIQVPVLFGEDVPYLYIEKADLLRHVLKFGDQETGMKLDQDQWGYSLERVYGECNGRENS